ncbi:MAG TPA: substrate-binding domain-containing protein [Solirubrobacterales bacterium]|nr:substrate-binding domain-containing protein [Solirubrobacterales bacterium]
MGEPFRPGDHRRVRRLLAALSVGLAIIALGGLIAACGGGGSSSGESTEAAGAESSEESSAKSESGTSEVVAAAEKASAPYFKPPPNVGNTVPLKEAPPTGLHVVALSCELSVCEGWRDGVEEAGKLLGWTTKKVAFSGAPEDDLAKISQAVSEHPDAILIDGIARETYEPAAEAAADAGIPIVTQLGELTGKATPPFIEVDYQQGAFDTMSEATANWFIADSEGKGDALLVQYAGFPLSTRIIETTSKTVADNCPECKTKTITAQAEDTGTKLPSIIIGELQRDPSMNYVILQDMVMATGLEAALREAGLLGKVKIMGNDATPEAMKSVEEGNFLGVMAYSQLSAAYQGIDAVARHAVGMPQQDEVPLMTQIFTKENLPPNATEETWNNLPPTLKQEYEELWQVSK